MIKIALCDDDISELNELMNLLRQYHTEYRAGVEFNYTAFQSPLELLAVVERGVRFDIFFLDILMPGQNGIETAAEIRNYDSSAKIIFLTASSEFAVQSYTVNAYFYQLKPLRAEALFRLMDSVLEFCRKEQFDGFILRCRTGITRLEPRKLEFCEVVHRTIFLHLISGRVLESTGKLDELEYRLEGYGGFLRPHRSFLINMEYVQEISYRAITMSCLTQIPIPHGKYSRVKAAFLEYAAQKGRVKL